MARKIINYLNNKDILKEIHKSKSTYCSFNNNSSEYDIILSDISEILDNIAQAKQNKADRLTKSAVEAQAELGVKIKADSVAVDPNTLKTNELVFRVMTWEHIPPLTEVVEKSKSCDLSELFEIAPTEYDIDLPIPDLPDRPAKYTKVNFPPFQHFSITDNDQIVCIGKSHWKGNIDTGTFSKEHGNMTPKLATMFIKLCERYATRSNWRGYCVDSDTEALTQRGWLGIDQITEDDTILSYSESDLTWSSIKSIYRGKYDGLMHYITSRSVDALVTPHHKLVTGRGLIEAELIKQSDQVIIMGNAVSAPIEKTYSDSFVELVGWIMTEGCYQLPKNSIQVSQNPGAKADRIRHCLNMLNFKFSESLHKNNLCFSLNVSASKQIFEIFPIKNLNMDFILALTADQRELLIKTMIDGDGWYRKGNNMSYCQKDKEHVDLFQALLTLAGKKSNYHYIVDHPSFRKLVNFYSVNVFSKRGNKTNGGCLNFNGGLNNGVGLNRGRGKSAFPNTPTVQYNGMVWCPETEYGCFVARRNGKVYLTGNTYNDEMRSQALLQLSQIGLQFDENKSNNPFAYYTAVITNSFTRVLNIEKRNQNIRDDILQMNNLNPSYTRQNSGGSDYDGGHDE